MSSQILRIVVASPNDVKIEREIVEEVAEELNRGIAAVFGLRLEVIRWETDAFPGFHRQGPQALIDTRLRIEDSDLLVGIFWKRIGTPIHRANSGTEHEFQIAYQSWKTTGRPQIMVYFNQKPYMPSSKAETDQQGRVFEFKDTFPEEGLWWPYKGKFQFEKSVRNHLTQFILHRATLESAEAKSGSIEPETIVDAETVRKRLHPGGEVARRPLHFIWMVDCSASMTGDKIQVLNNSMRETIPRLQEAARDNSAEMLIRVVAFSDGAHWHVATPTPVENFRWKDLTAGGVTDAGAALRLVAEQLKTPPMPTRALPPVLVLLLDGSPTDDFSEGLRRLNEQAWGKKSVRLGIAVGADADTNALQSFIGTHDRQPFSAHNAYQLFQYIKWTSTSVVGSIARPGLESSVQIPTPGESAEDAW